MQMINEMKFTECLAKEDISRRKWYSRTNIDQHTQYTLHTASNMSLCRESKACLCLITLTKCIKLLLWAAIFKATHTHTHHKYTIK